VFPADDGAGQPLGMALAPATAGYLQMRFLNAGDAPIDAQVTLGAGTLPGGTAYTASATYATYNGNIDIPAMAIGHVETQTCAVPAGSKFWRLTTRTHKHATKAAIKDSGSTVFEATDWENPGAASYPAAPFLEFASGTLTNECTYNNPTASPISDGDSADTDETCEAIGYFFPAAVARFCFNGFLVP